MIPTQTSIDIVITDISVIRILELLEVSIGDQINFKKHVREVTEFYCFEKC